MKYSNNSVKHEKMVFSLQLEGTIVSKVPKELLALNVCCLMFVLASCN